MACPDGDPDDVARCIEAAVRAGNEAVNKGNFDPYAPPWHALADDFRSNNPTGGRTAADTKIAYLAEWERIRRHFPNHKITVLDLATTFFSTGDIKRAEVYQHGQVTGGPGTEAGVSRNYVSLLEAECRNGIWYCISETSVDGVGTDGMN